MASFTVGKIECLACGRKWDGVFADYYIKEKSYMWPICDKCFLKIKKFIKTLK